MRFFLLIILLFGFSHAAGALATITKVEGSVKLLKTGEIKKSDAAAGQEIFEGDMVITESASMASILFIDQSKVVLDEKAKLKLEGFDKLAQEGGKVYYSIKKRGAQGLKVATNFAVIGVKGTKFLVSDDENNRQVSLKEGLVGVQSLKEEFELHRKKEMDEYEAYKRQMAGEFDEYKKELEEGFVEFVKEFDLQPNKTISFDGNKVNEEASLETIAKEFSRFESF
jgi:hypothetical protein